MRRVMRCCVALVAFAVIAPLSACAAEPPAGPRSSIATSPEHLPEPPPPPPPPSPEEIRRERAEQIVASMDDRSRVASVLMGMLSTTDAAAVQAFVTGNGLGGLIVMGGNVLEPAQLRAMLDALVTDPSFPPLIATDQEGGDVVRLPWDPNAGADLLKYEPPEAAGTAFASRAALLRDAGLNVNFGVIADVPSSEQSFIFRRSFGIDPLEAAPRVAAAVTAEHSVIASTLKHFPGHGAAEGDSHGGIPVADLDYENWAATAARPFSAGIEAGAQLLMFGHLSFPAIDPLPASLSPAWYRIAREDLGFRGVSITDDLGMLPRSGIPEYQDLGSLVVTALGAGADLALVMQGTGPESMPALIDQVAAAVQTGVLSADRLREAAVRVAELRLTLGTPG